MEAELLIQIQKKTKRLTELMAPVGGEDLDKIREIAEQMLVLNIDLCCLLKEVENARYSIHH
jgi:hypothetical protein